MRSLQLEIDRDSPHPLYRQLIESIRKAIAEGTLQSGDRIPSATSLSKSLGIGRPTAVRALSDLERTGDIVSQVGRGSFVAEPQSDPTSRDVEARVESAASADLQRIVNRLREKHMRSIAQLIALEQGTDIIDLRQGFPRSDQRIGRTLQELAGKVLAVKPQRLARYAPHGVPELTTALAEWMNHRGYGVTPSELLITNGAMDAIALLVRWARQRELQAYCETPTWWGIFHAFSHSDQSIESVPWQADQIATSTTQGAPITGPGLLYCCPEFHNPTGRTLSKGGRRRLVDLAVRQDLVVIVDDVFRDLRFCGTERPSLYEELPVSHRVLVGSFSKSFAPGLRVGFIAAETAMISRLASMKQYLDLGGPPLMQAMAASFLQDGYARHLDRVRDAYRRQSAALLAGFDKHMPSAVTVSRPEGGFHLWVELPPDHSAMSVYLAGLKEGVAIAPGPMHDLDGRYRNCFRISYAHASTTQLEKAATIVSKLCARALAEGPTEASTAPLPL